MNGVKNFLVAALVVLLALMFINSLANGVWGILEFIAMVLIVVGMVLIVVGVILFVKNAIIGAKKEILNTKETIEHKITSTRNYNRLLNDVITFINANGPYTKISVSHNNLSRIYVKKQTSECAYDVVQHGYSKPRSASAYLDLFRELATVVDGKVTKRYGVINYDRDDIIEIIIEPWSLVRAREAQQKKAEQEYRKNAWF